LDGVDERRGVVRVSIGELGIWVRQTENYLWDGDTG